MATDVEFNFLNSLVEREVKKKKRIPQQSIARKETIKKAYS